MFCLFLHPVRLNFTFQPKLAFAYSTYDSPAGSTNQWFCIISSYFSLRLFVIASTECVWFAVVVPLLHRYLSTSATSSSVSKQAVRCFSSWAQFGLPLPDSEPVIAQVFTALCTESHFDVVVEALISVFSHPDNYRSSNVIFF